VLVFARPRVAGVAAPLLGAHEVNRAVVELGVDDAHLADPLLAERLPDGLRGLTEQAPWAPPELEAARLGEGDELLRLFVPEREGLLGVHVLARLERRLRDREVALGVRQVQDELDARIAEDRGDRG